MKSPVCSKMDNHYFPIPWQSLAIPRSFSEVIKEDSTRTYIYGPFSVYFEYRDDASVNVKKVWPEHSDEYALCLEIIKEDRNNLWSWYSNRYHYFSPDHTAYFQDDILHFVCSTQNERFKHVSFKPLTQTEWSNFLGSDFPESAQERVDLVVKKYYAN